MTAKKERRAVKDLQREALKTEVHPLVRDYLGAKGVDRIIAETLVMMGVKPTRKQIENVRSAVTAKLRNEVDPRKIKEEIKTGKPGPVKYAAMDIIKERKPTMEQLSSEELRMLSQEKERLREALRKPRFSKPEIVKKVERLRKKRKA